MINEIFKEHLKNIGMQEDAINEIFTAETLSDEQKNSVTNLLSQTMTVQKAIADRNVRNAVIKDVMEGTEKKIFDDLVANQIIEPEFTKTLADSNRLSEKMKLTVDHILKTRTGDKKSQVLQAQIEELQSKLDSGANDTNSRVKTLNQQIETLKGELSERDKKILDQNNKFQDWKIKSFIETQLDSIPLSDNGDSNYRRYIRETIIGEAKKSATWTNGKSDNKFQPMQLDDPSLPIYGSDQINPISAFDFIQQIAKPYIRKDGGGGNGNPGNGKGGNNKEKDPQLAKMDAEQRKRYLASLNQIHQD